MTPSEQHIPSTPSTPPDGREEAEMRFALQRMDAAPPDVDAAWKEVTRRIDGHEAESRRETILRRLKPLAAVAAVAAGLVFLLYPQGKQTVGYTADAPAVSQQQHSKDSLGRQPEKMVAQTAPPDNSSTQQEAQTGQGTQTTNRGQQRSLRLPDGTKVWLNACSQLSYDFTDAERSVTLRGQAYFDVKHNAGRPFTVSTPYFIATDLGTTFDVKAYSAREAAVTLVSGLVAVEAGGERLTLQPGQQAALSGGRLSVTHVDTYPLTQWREGWFYFHNEPMSHIMQELSRWYGVNVVFESTSAADRRLHFVASHKESLDSIVGRLSQMDDIEVELTGKKIIVK